MSLINLAVGYNAPGQNAEPALIYVGRSGAALNKALDASPCARFELFRNLLGIRKNNPNAARNAAALRNLDATTEQLGDDLAAIASQLAEEKVALQQQLDAAQAQIADLEQKLSSKRKK